VVEVVIVLDTAALVDVDEEVELVKLVAVAEVLVAVAEVIVNVSDVLVVADVNVVVMEVVEDERVAEVLVSESVVVVTVRVVLVTVRVVLVTVRVVLVTVRVVLVTVRVVLVCVAVLDDSQLKSRSYASNDVCSISGGTSVNR
jgi:hypothetical protein